MKCNEKKSRDISMLPPKWHKKICELFKTLKEQCSHSVKYSSVYFYDISCLVSTTLFPKLDRKNTHLYTHMPHTHTHRTIHKHLQILLTENTNAKILNKIATQIKIISIPKIT